MPDAQGIMPASPESGIHTRLNTSEGGGAGGSSSDALADLDISPELLQRLSGHADTLAGQLDTVLPHLRSESATAAGGVAGLASVQALNQVRSSWEGRLTDVQEECVRLRDGFTAAARGFEGTEADVRDSLQPLRQENARADGSAPWW